MFRYYIRGKIFPALLTSVPLFIFFDKLMELQFYGLIKPIPQFLIALIGLASAAVLVFLSMQLNRLVLKLMVKINYFRTEIEIPTTAYLLWKNNLIDEPTKETIRSKIQAKLGVHFMEETNDSGNEAASKKQITTVVSQIKRLLRNNKLFIQHNMEYEFFLNLIAGCLIACLFSFALILLADYYNNESIRTTGIIFLLAYILPLLFRKFFIQQLVNYYSNLFYEVFLGLENE